MSRRLMAVAAVFATLAVAATSAVASTTAATPGVTAKTITLGGTFPLTGPVSAYAPIPTGMKVYFSYVNATRAADKKRGVGGRQIIWKFLDDQYNNPTTVQLTRQLVEQDKVFAMVGGLGTEPQEAVRQYLNDSKVPTLFVSTGAAEWGNQYAQYPWTIGWQPDYEAEGRIYGKYVADKLPAKKIGIIFQNDSVGTDYNAGFKAGLGAKASNIVVSQGAGAADPSVASQIVALKAANPDVVAIFATPPIAIKAFATMKALAFKPETTFLANVSATEAYMKLAVANAGAAQVNGTISTGYVKDPNNPKYASDPAVVLYKKLMAKYAPSANASDGGYMYGVAKAYDTVMILRKLGKNPTRAALQAAWANINWTNPFLLSGVKVQTSKTDRFPIRQMKLITYNDGLWSETSDLISGRGV